MLLHVFPSCGNFRGSTLRRDDSSAVTGLYSMWKAPCRRWRGSCHSWLQRDDFGKDEQITASVKPAPTWRHRLCRRLGDREAPRSASDLKKDICLARGHRSPVLPEFKQRLPLLQLWHFKYLHNEWQIISNEGFRLLLLFPGNGRVMFKIVLLSIDNYRCSHRICCGCP